MACPKCNNVKGSGPTSEQLCVDPFAPGPAPYFYRCPSCGQQFGTRDPRRGHWLEMTRAEVSALVDSHYIQLPYSF